MSRFITGISLIHLLMHKNINDKSGSLLTRSAPLPSLFLRSTRNQRRLVFRLAGGLPESKVDGGLDDVGADVDCIRLIETEGERQRVWLFSGGGYRERRGTRKPTLYNDRYC